MVGLWLKKPGDWVAVAGPVVIIFLAAKVWVEEGLLGVRYPDYAEYKTRTWGLFPGVRGQALRIEDEVAFGAPTLVRRGRKDLHPARVDKGLSCFGCAGSKRR